MVKRWKKNERTDLTGVPPGLPPEVPPSPALPELGPWGHHPHQGNWLFTALVTWYTQKSASLLSLSFSVLPGNSPPFLCPHFWQILMSSGHFQILKSSVRVLSKPNTSVSSVKRSSPLRYSASPRGLVAASGERMRKVCSFTLPSFPESPPAPVMVRGRGKQIRRKEVESL